MSWTLEFDAQARRDMRRLAPLQRGRILRYLNERVLVLDNPRQLGGTLKGSLSKYWRYRVGDLRVLAHIDDGKLVILVITVGNRREIYR